MLTTKREDICRELWKTIMPAEHFNESDFNETARYWNNPDWIDVTLTHYNLRWLVGTGDPRYKKLEVAHDAKPNISVPTILIYGEKDGGALPATIIGDQKNFTGTYEQILLPEVGHFVTHEDPTSVVNIILRGTQAASR